MKKYSDKFLNQHYKLKKAVIGMEFEFYVKEFSYYKTMEMLNKELSPVKVWGFRQYHSGFETDELNFKIEPDLSGGSNMVELITGPLKYYDAKYYLIKIAKFIQNYGYTNNKSSIHFNISFNDDEKDLNDLNILKLILNVDEDEVYRLFPSRKNNVYAKTIQKIIPYKDYDFYNVPILSVKNNIKIPNDKYYGVNFLNIIKDRQGQRLEFRYIGGKDYEKNIGTLIYFMDRFIINSYDCIDTDFNQQEIDKLESYLDINIMAFKSLSRYDNFIINYPKIQLQIDQDSNYDVVNAYYNNIYSKLYNLFDSMSEIGECIINYVTTTQKIEIVDAKIKSISNIKNCDFINCELGGLYENCMIIGGEIRNSHIVKCEVKKCDIYDSKVFSCDVDDCMLNSCYYMDGYMNSQMIGGVFRCGKLGPYASMDSDVKIITDYDNFFNTVYDTESKTEDDGEIKAYGKPFSKK
jgi:hypothetical protein